MSTLFDPPGAAWHRLDPAYLKVVRLTTLATSAGVLALGSAGFYLFLDWRWAAAFAGIWLAWTLFVLWRHGRRIPAVGYAERGEDFLIVTGLWSKSLTLIPYGRIDVVTVTDGPLLRKYGLANIAISTASPASSALPGLSRPDAEALRDRLLEKAESREAGF